MSSEQLPPEPLDHPLRLTLRLAGLLFVVWTLLQQAPDGRRAHAAALALTIGFAASWIGWVAATRLSRHRLFVVALFGLSVSGAALVGVAPMGMVGPAVAGLAGGASFAGARLAALAVVGPAVALISVWSADRPLGYAAGAAAAATAGVLGGVSRRQFAMRARQAAELEAAEARAEAEHTRAQLLAERNEMARDLHDVLAHTLGALAVQLEALDALSEATDTPSDVQAGLRKSRALVTDGLNEARRAVRALREEPVPLVDRLGAMADESGAHLLVTGAVRPTPATVQAALARAAQESLTNARKHAAGAEVRMVLAFEADTVELTVTNSGNGSAAPIAESGSGLGLQGMRERVTLLAGGVEAGPTNDGWRVRVTVPA